MLSLFLYYHLLIYCIIFHMKNCKPTFAPPCMRKCSDMGYSNSERRGAVRGPSQHGHVANAQVEENFKDSRQITVRHIVYAICRMKSFLNVCCEPSTKQKYLQKLCWLILRTSLWHWYCCSDHFTSKENKMQLTWNNLSKITQLNDSAWLWIHVCRSPILMILMPNSTPPFFFFFIPQVLSPEMFSVYPTSLLCHQFLIS